MSQAIKHKQWLSDEIGEEYRQWEKGDIVLIGSGTGTGKSYFIRNQLSRYADEQWADILFVFNRKQLHKQNLEQLKADNNLRVHTATYQEIEYDIITSGQYDFDRYAYIVCDECHYFTEDSTFNHNSDLSLNAILNLNGKVRIFMSATGGTLFSYIRRSFYSGRLWNYPHKRQFKQIDKLYFYSDDKSVKQYIDQHLTDEDKIIWFCKSTEKAARLHMEYPDSYFLCSESINNKKYLHLIDENTIINDEGRITFNKRFLFTTKVLDNGFDLKDERIKLIVCDEFDINTMVQCIGRKRMLNYLDKVTVILFNHSNKSINGYRNVLIDKIKEADVFCENGVAGRNEFVGRFAHKSNYIIYDIPSPDNKYVCRKAISKVKYLKAQNDLSIVDEMLNNNREQNRYRMDNGEKKKSDAYMIYIMQYLDINKCGDLDRIYQTQELSEFLDNIVGKVMLVKNDRQELIEKVNVRVDGHQLKSANSLNAALAERGFNYYIKEFETSRVIDGKLKKFKSAWKVMRLIDK